MGLTDAGRESDSVVRKVDSREGSGKEGDPARRWRAGSVIMGLIFSRTVSGSSFM